jgi:glycosyltransferase involved in cell wall biosynthesis
MVAIDQAPVSVIIPTYNRARFILRSLDSVLAAVKPNDEVIVVDDGSTDNTREALEPYLDRIRYVVGPHRGVGAARNCGIAHARNPLLAFNDSDDEWFADKLLLQRTFMQARPDVLFCFSDLGLRAEDGTESHHGLYGWHLDPRSWNEILGPGVAYSSIAPPPAGYKDFNVHIGDLYPAMLRCNYVAAQSSMIRREPAGDALRFSEDIAIYEDYECFTRLARAGRAAYFDCETVWQWGHDDRRVSDADERLRAMCRVKVLKRTFGSDRQFLAKHNDLYQQALRVEHVTLARRLLRDGRRQEAREELRLAGGGPLFYRLLAAAPGPLMRATIGLRRWGAKLAPDIRRRIITKLLSCN